MPPTYPISFRLSLIFIFLVPLFFVPGGALYLDSAKSALFIIGLIVLSLSFLFESMRRGSLTLPRHYLVMTLALLPVLYLISALISAPSSLSLLGYNLEVGTFGFMLLGAMAALLFGSFYSDTTRFLQALVAFFASLSLLALFVLIKIWLGGNALSFGNFFGNMGNPLGSWTDLGIVFGLLSLLSALAIGMVPMRAMIKAVLYIVFALSLALLMVINFTMAFSLTLGASILLLIYFSFVERHFLYGEEGSPRGKFFSQATLLPLILAVASLLFLINPTISASKGKLGHFISSTFGVENADVRPSFSATLGISKAVLSETSLLGSGPNTFSQDWLIYKPVTVNTTPFWGMTFPFGIGFVATQVATTGIVGSVLWLIFFASLIILSFKLLSSVPEARSKRFTLIATLFSTLFLWAAALFYAPSASVMMLAFVFLGLILAMARDGGLLSLYSVDLKYSSPARYATLGLMTLATLGVLYLGFVGGEKTLGAYHFKKAVDQANAGGTLVQIEGELKQALSFDDIDIYYTALSRLNFNKAQTAAAATTGKAEENRALFEEGVRGAIENAQLAAKVNPASYGNWISLGSIYAALVPAPLNLEGAYENAQMAYTEALSRNPNNPELPLFMAQLELAHGSVEAARSSVRKSIALKEDYADAYLLLAQIEARENNIPAAIESTEALARLVPDNAGIHFELGLLKYSVGDNEGAVASFLKATKIIPEYANAKYYLALAYSKLGFKVEAKKELEDLLVTNPESPEVIAALKTLSTNKVRP